MADKEHDGIFREIDEELRQEHYAKLWKSYGTFIVGVALALVISVAGYQGWRSYDLKTRQADGEKFALALNLSQDKKSDEARRAFLDLAAKAGSGYAMLAKFQDAALLAESGKDADAAAAYKDLAGDSSIDAVYRDLALLLGVMSEMNTGTGGDRKELARRLAPLTADNNPWRFTARELTAVLAYRAGDTARARELYSALESDAFAPRGLRTRAQEMLAALKS